MDIEVYTILGSDCAEFVLFEPDEIIQYAGVRADWCADDAVQLSLANAGRAVFLPVGVDGFFRFRITTGSLTPQEAEDVILVERRCWLETNGHDLRFGGLETLPTGIGGETVYIYEDEYVTIPCDQGMYHVEIYRLGKSLEMEDEIENAETADRNQDSDSTALPSYILRLMPFAPGETPIHLDVMPS